MLSLGTNQRVKPMDTFYVCTNHPSFLCLLRKQNRPSTGHLAEIEDDQACDLHSLRLEHFQTLVSVRPIAS